MFSGIIALLKAFGVKDRHRFLAPPKAFGLEPSLWVSTAPRVTKIVSTTARSRIRARKKLIMY